MTSIRDELLRLGIPVASFDVEKGARIPEQVASLLVEHGERLKKKDDSEQGNNDGVIYKTVIMLGWGAGSDEMALAFGRNANFEAAAKAFTKAGGNFLVQGERIKLCCGDWPAWFDKSWTDGSYFRTDHTCFAVPKAGQIQHWCKWYHKAKGALLGNLNVKACMVEGVPADEVLFGTEEGARSYSLVPGFGGQEISAGSAAFAWGKYGEGTVCFFGDVNFEEGTIRTVGVIVRGEEK